GRRTRAAIARLRPAAAALLVRGFCPAAARALIAALGPARAGALVRRLAPAAAGPIAARLPALAGGGSAPLRRAGRGDVALHRAERPGGVPGARPAERRVRAHAGRRVTEGLRPSQRRQGPAEHHPRSPHPP